MNLKKLNKEIEIKNEKQIKILIVMIILQHVLLYLFDLIRFVDKYWPWGPNIATVLLRYITFAPILIAYFKFGLYREKLNFKNYRQYIIGVLLLVPVYLCSLLTDKFYVFGDFSDYARYPGDTVWNFFYFFFSTALCEEFIYRLYIQGELTVLLGRAKILAPLITAALFGYAHIVQGTLWQVEFTFFMGLVLGYAKLYIKNCTFISVVVAHGLYDFLLSVSPFL